MPLVTIAIGPDLPLLLFFHLLCKRAWLLAPAMVGFIQLDISVMMGYRQYVMKLAKGLFSPTFMGVLSIVLVVALALATFIENDYGQEAARSMVYGKWWFELLFVLVAANLAGQIVIFRLYRSGKITILLFHVGFLLIIAGAAVTRYTGYEGIMHIREGEAGSAFYSSSYYLNLSITDSTGRTVASESSPFEITPVSVGSFSLSPGGGVPSIRFVRYIPNAGATLADGEGGDYAVSLMVTHGMGSPEMILMMPGAHRHAAGISFGFETGQDENVTIKLDEGRPFFIADRELTASAMGTEEAVHYDAGIPVPVEPMTIYSDGHRRIVPRHISESAVVRPVPVDVAEARTGAGAMEFRIEAAGLSRTLFLWDYESEIISEAEMETAGYRIAISYGPTVVDLPFSIRLNEFILDRYPGSNSPSGYTSRVTLIDERRDHKADYDIFMNNILDYSGYRFFQSSYDDDEMGTILSVNRDRPGMIVTYSGYFLLTLFTILSLFAPASLFRTVKAGAWSSRLRRGGLVVALLALPLSGDLYSQKLIVDEEMADRFGRILVQDRRGRTKPLFTLSNEVVRKLSGGESYRDYSSMQVFLGLTLDFSNWQHEPLIRVRSRDIERMAGAVSGMVAFSDLVSLTPQPHYLLNDMVDRAHAIPPGQRGRSEKEVVRVDERINIAYLVGMGELLRIFPLKDGTTMWGSVDEALEKATDSEDSLFVANILTLYRQAVVEGNHGEAERIVEAIERYQERFAGYDLPSETKISAEILYHRTGLYKRLMPLYGLAGLAILLFLLYRVISGTGGGAGLLSATRVIVVVLLLAHTGGLALRWYISGHSPMSNGYESMIFIAWVTVLGGLIFSRRSWFALAATMLLAAAILMVANLNFMDPEITTLVPVLQSYWLIFHVSVITAGYGFFGLSAVLGLISMVLMLFVNSGNLKRISDTTDELLVINYQSMTLGLYFMVIGTFLGAVWANESWGRYWGWDPKETWSLITIIVYSFVIHSRTIPGMRDLYTFNFMSLFALSSVIMTYFGVNYFLSGLHSYAGGDPVQIPTALYITVAVLITLSVMAYRQYIKTAVLTDGD